MAECQGSIPITTKVDTESRDLVDEIAENEDLTRSDVIRRLIALLRQSKEEGLACPTCNEPVRIPIDSHRSALDAAGQALATPETETAVCSETKDEPGTSSTEAGEVRNGPTTTAPTERAIANFRDQLEYIREKVVTQEQELAEMRDTTVGIGRFRQLEGHVSDLDAVIHRLQPRVEATVHASRLISDGECSACGGTLSVEHSFDRLGQPPAITCSNCGREVGYLDG